VKTSSVELPVPLSAGGWSFGVVCPVALWQTGRLVRPLGSGLLELRHGQLDILRAGHASKLNTSESLVRKSPGTTHGLLGLPGEGVYYRVARRVGRLTFPMAFEREGGKTAQQIDAFQNERGRPARSGPLGDVELTGLSGAGGQDRRHKCCLAEDVRSQQRIRAPATGLSSA
jgi:hypothetical protein